MAKFAVGEIAVLYPENGSKLGYSGEQVSIVGIGPNPLLLYREPSGIFSINVDYEIKLTDGTICGAMEYELRKLPGDSTSLPSWLTNMLKTPQGDPDKVKKPENV